MPLASFVFIPLKGKRVERLNFLRKCSVTGHDITPIRAVPKQQSLV